jgi:hypothetical protein
VRVHAPIVINNYVQPYETDKCSLNTEEILFFFVNLQPKCWDCGNSLVMKLFVIEGTMVLSFGLQSYSVQHFIMVSSKRERVRQ